MHGIAVLSIAVLLGSTSAVLGDQLPWREVVKYTRELYRFGLGVRSPIEYSNFDKPIEFACKRPRNYNRFTDNAFVVTQTDQSLPQITVGGQSYKLYAFVYRLISSFEEVANLIVIFNIDGQYKCDKSVALFIPISLSETDENLNGPLNGDLSTFSKLPSGRTHTVTSVQWLKPLMEEAILVPRPGSESDVSSRYTFESDIGKHRLPDVSYLIDTVSVTVSKDSVKAFT